MNVRDKPCPACGAAPGERCTTTGGRPTDIHNARYNGEVTPRTKMRPRRPR